MNSPVPDNNTTKNEPFEGNGYCGTPFWYAINIFIIITIITGNLLTILAILLSRKLSSLVANQFIFSLAVSDLLVACTVPYHMAFYTVEGFGTSRTNCILRFVLISFACSSSIWNLLCIATDRYIAIVYPLHYARKVTRTTSLLMISFGWILSFSTISTVWFWNNWREGVSCELVEVLPKNYINYIMFPMFVMIWTIMLLLYSRICREANGHAKRIKSSSSAQNILALRDSKSFQVMLTILGYFTVLWLPYFVITICARYYREGNFAVLYEIAFNLAVANSGMNPVIYAWKNNNFRAAFLRLMRCRSPDQSPSTQYITNHVPSKRNSLSINGVSNGLCDEKDVMRCENVTDVLEMKRRTNGNIA